MHHNYCVLQLHYTTESVTTRVEGTAELRNKQQFNSDNPR